MIFLHCNLNGSMSRRAPPYLQERSGYSYGTRTATCICYLYGSQNVSLDFSVIADSSLSKLLYLPLEGLSDPSECPFFEPD